MRDPQVIQKDAWQRTRAEAAFRERMAAGDAWLHLTEAELERISRVIGRYRLTTGVAK